jgi:hypothetical protein
MCVLLSDHLCVNCLRLVDRFWKRRSGTCTLVRLVGGTISWYQLAGWHCATSTNYCLNTLRCFWIPCWEMVGMSLQQTRSLDRSSASSSFYTCGGGHQALKKECKRKENCQPPSIDWRYRPWLCVYLACRWRINHDLLIEWGGASNIDCMHIQHVFNTCVQVFMNLWTCTIIHLDLFNTRIRSIEWIRAHAIKFQ